MLALPSSLRTYRSAVVLVLVPTLVLGLAFSAFHLHAQANHAGFAHPYLDGSLASTMRHVAHVGPTWVAGKVLGHGGNDGWVDTEWNDRWEENWDEVDMMGATPGAGAGAGSQTGPDTAGETYETRRWPAVHAEPAPFRGIVSMSRQEQAQTAAAVRRTIDKMRLFWAAESQDLTLSRTTTLERLDRLATCLETRSCRRGETTVVIGGSHHFGNAFDGAVGGEDVWARSVFNATHDLGHTLLFANHGLEAATLYAEIPHLVAAVILEADKLFRCAELGVPHRIKADDLKPSDQQGDRVDYADAMRIRAELGLSTEESEVEGEIWGWRGTHGLDRLKKHNATIGCMKRRGFDQGIPLWKTFSFHFWASPEHPLGHAWTLAPEDYGHQPGMGNGAHNFYLGYAVERACTQIPTVPQEERKQRAFILAKEAWMFQERVNVWWTPNGTFQHLADQTGIGFLATAVHPVEDGPEPVIDNVGRVPRKVFEDEVAHSIAMVGIGAPSLSPSPYESLCLGVPFINPVKNWHRQEPLDRNHWDTQHNGLLDVDPPAVYHVHAHDIDALADALRSAAQNPIDRFIPERMTTKAMARRMQTLVNLDWKDLFLRKVAKENLDTVDSLKVFLY